MEPARLALANQIFDGVVEQLKPKFEGFGLKVTMGEIPASSNPSSPRYDFGSSAVFRSGFIDPREPEHYRALLADRE